ncbi:MAG: phosphatidate cytidylyltransferase [Nitrospirae bacterium]|nr:phosphatidate cytidylyltransferase [Nitrospirota bacterium]
MAQSNKKTSSVVMRHIIAALFLPVFIAYIYYLPPLPYFMMLLIIACMTALWEFYAMYKVPAKLSVPGVILGGLLLYISCSYPELFLTSIFISLFILMLIRLFAEKTPSGCMTEIGPLAAGLFYVGIFLSFQWLLRSGPLGMEYIFMLYTCVWLADGGAFYIGTYMGKHKLYPSISPNKTWEGAYGSLIGGALGALIIRMIFDMPLSIGSAVVIGAIIGVAALVGDLVESMFKRDAGVKDSGVFIPGHGGMLDKLDGMLVAGPVLYLLVRYI